jgi:hypothetical protein
MSHMSEQEWASVVDQLNQIPVLVEQQRSARTAVDGLYKRVYQLKHDVDEGKMTRDEFQKQVTPLRMELLLMDFLLQVHGHKLESLMKVTTETRTE